MKAVQKGKKKSLQENSSGEETVGEIIHYKIQIKNSLFLLICSHTLWHLTSSTFHRYLVYEFKNHQLNNHSPKSSTVPLSIKSSSLQSWKAGSFAGSFADTLLLQWNKPSTSATSIHLHLKVTQQNPALKSSLLPCNSNRGKYLEYLGKDSRSRERQSPPTIKHVWTVPRNPVREGTEIYLLDQEVRTFRVDLKGKPRSLKNTAYCREWKGKNLCPQVEFSLPFCRWKPVFSALGLLWKEQQPPVFKNKQKKTEEFKARWEAQQKKNRKRQDTCSALFFLSGPF